MCTKLVYINELSKTVSSYCEREDIRDKMANRTALSPVVSAKFQQDTSRFYSLTLYRYICLHSSHKHKERWRIPTMIRLEVLLEIPVLHTLTV